MTIEQLLETALALHRAGDLAGAAVAYQKVLDVDPELPAPLYLLGMVEFQLGNPDRSIDLLQKTIKSNPDFADSYNILGSALLQRGRKDEAIAIFEKAASLEPQNYAVRVNLANALSTATRLADAQQHLEHAIAIQPNQPEAYNNLGNLLRDARKYEESIPFFRKAIELRPNLAEPHYGLSTVFSKLGELDETIAEQRKALAIKPDLIEAHSNLLMTLHYKIGLDRETIYAEHRKWEARFAAPLYSQIRSHTNNPDPDRRLRLGYVSRHLRKNVVGDFLDPILRDHDRSQFEIFCYDDLDTLDDKSVARLKSHCDHWRHTANLNEVRVAQNIRDDAIDILIELSGHTISSRLRTLAYKPAPVQVTYLGYPDTTGMTVVDYLITDEIVDPPGVERFYTEKLIRLPRGFSCYERDTNDPITPLPAERNGFITFASLHGPVKLNPEVIELWTRVLLSVPDSRLLIFRDSLSVSLRERIANQVRSLGVDPSRVIFQTKHPGGRWILVYQDVDIALDAFPWSGHTTACDGMWMGVPMVTLLGDVHAGRMTASVLTQVGLTELIASNKGQFVEIATKLANDRPRLSHLRAQLRQMIQHSPLGDVPAFTRDLENAYREMWRTWCAQQPAR